MCFVSLFVHQTLSAQPAPPQAAIGNGIVDATIYLPDGETGYYRGKRFDWSGVIPKLTYKGHNYFGKWFSRYEPTGNDAITGPVEEFTTLGYDDAKVGETFIKIGVGVLRKPDEPRYNFTTPYELVNAGQRSLKKKADQVAFTHTLTDASGYAYAYQKTVRLTPGKPQLVIEHRLKNTGTRTIESNVYDHNFLMIDEQPSGPDFTVTFPFTLVPTDSLPNALDVQDKRITYRRLLNRESVYMGLKGFGTTADDYDIRVENQKTKAGVRIRSNRPLSKLAFWTSPTNLSPEPFIAVRAEPGKEFTWTLTYDFYTLP
ncbi:hypothetical protein HU175_14415 [Spirosoma sp. KUDC1026]|nr:hypothetical protein HU175_14415 [Spirosoma sp. KUDC1026]